MPENHVNRLDDWVAETPESIAARLEGAKASQAQIRWTIGVMAIISVMMLIASYNAYISYDYEWVVQVTDRQMAAEKEEAEEKRRARDESPERLLAVEKEMAERRLATGKAVSGVLMEQALKDWASARIVQVPPLGIRVSVDDAPVLGTSVLLIISLWLLLVARRENHTIGSLLRDTDTEGPDDNRNPLDARSMGGRRHLYPSGERWLIFHTIISNSLFVACDHSLAGVRSLRDSAPAAAAATRRFKDRLSRLGFRVVRSFFFLFPIVASLVVFGLDRRSYYIPDPFELGAKIPGTDLPFYRGSMVVFFVCWILLMLCCWISSQYSRATEQVLNEYGQKLRADLYGQQLRADLSQKEQPAEGLRTPGR